MEHVLSASAQTLQVAEIEDAVKLAEYIDGWVILVTDSKVVLFFSQSTQARRASSATPP